MSRCTERYYVVKGMVIDGIGEGAKYVKLYSKIIKEVLGLEPYPGTLNIELHNIARELLYGQKPPILIPPPGENLGRVFSWRVFIKFNNKCIPAYALKPEKSVHKDNVIELISDRYLRGFLGIKSGDIIELILTPDDATPCVCI